MKIVTIGPKFSGKTSILTRWNDASKDIAHLPPTPYNYKAEKIYIHGKELNAYDFGGEFYKDAIEAINSLRSQDQEFANIIILMTDLYPVSQIPKYTKENMVYDKNRVQDNIQYFKNLNIPINLLPETLQDSLKLITLFINKIDLSLFSKAFVEEEILKKYNEIYSFLPTWAKSKYHPIIGSIKEGTGMPELFTKIKNVL